MNNIGLKKFDDVKFEDNKLKIILVVSNVFSGLLSLIAMLIGRNMDLFPSYISSFEFGVALLVALMVFVSSIGMWLRKGKFNSRFLTSITLYYIIYVHFRYEAVIYNTITAKSAITKMSFATVWVVIVWIYFLSKFYDQKIKSSKEQ